MKRYRKLFLKTLIMFVVVIINQSLLFAETKTPHDYEFPVNIRYNCNRCHGEQDLFGSPKTGEHETHIQFIKSSEATPFDGNIFNNGSYKNEDSDEYDDSSSNTTHWDYCDECHKLSTPDKDNKTDLHMNNFSDVSLGSDMYSGTSCSKSNKGKVCHKSWNEGDVKNWGAKGDVSEYMKNANSYFEEHKINNCVICHFPSLEMKRDDKTTLFLKSDIISMCNDCHGEFKRDPIKIKHPLNIKIEEQVFINREIPDKFGMDRYYFNTITCSTCHDPHGESCRTCHFNLNNLKVYKNKINNVSSKKNKVYLKIEDSVDIKFDKDLHSFKKQVYFQDGVYLEDPELKKVRDNLCNPCHTLETSLKVDVTDPHKEKKCIHCHKTIPTDPDEMCISEKALEVTDLKFRKGISREESYIKFDVLTLCNNCHRDKKHLHPINVKVKTKTPEDLKLDQWNNIICTTCHDPHTNYSNKKEVLLYRREGEKDGLCFICHANDPLFIKNNPHDYKDKTKCVYCHATEATTINNKSSETTGINNIQDLLSRKTEVYSKEFMERCNICHRRDINTHKTGVFLSEDIFMNYKRDNQDKITCGTCHDYHFVDKIILIPKVVKGRIDYCNQCHNLEQLKSALENMKKETIK